MWSRRLFFDERTAMNQVTEAQPLTVQLGEFDAAREIVYRHMRPTPTHNWPLLDQRTGCEVWVKHENMTPLGAFKVRGGLVMLSGLKALDPDLNGVISATRGNHGQSISYAARMLGLKAVIVVPFGNNPEINAAIKAQGAELIEHGEDFQEALEFTINLARERALKMIGPYETPLVRGVGTYAIELFEEIKNLDAVYVAIGMGSGISGLICARDAMGLKTEIIGVVAENAPAYALSFEKGEVVATNTADTLADGVACRAPDATAVATICKGAARIVRVSEDEILAAMGHYLSDTHNLAEGAGAVSLAALIQEKEAMKGKRVGLILSGGNLDRAKLRRVLDASDG